MLVNGYKLQDETTGVMLRVVRCVFLGRNEIYQVQDDANNRTFALKILSSGLRNDEISVRQFTQAAIMWMGLGAHPFLIKAHSVGFIDGRPYLVLDYVDGPPLRDVLHLGTIP